MGRRFALEEAKGRLGEYLAELGVDPDRASRSGSACPICGGGHKTPCFHFYAPDRWTCFSNCGSGDIFDLYAKLNGIGSGQSREAIDGVCGHFGIQADGAGGEGYTHTHTHRDEEVQDMKAVEDAERYVDGARAFIGDPEAVAYLNGRGLSLELAQRFGLGYDRAERRVVIPKDVGYKARAVDPAVEIRYKSPKGVSSGLFNAGELARSEADGVPVYVIEGEFDALSVIEAGGRAVALSSTSNVRKFIEEVAERPSVRVVVAMDNDEAGGKASKTLQEGLERLGVQFVVQDVAKGWKDANEALVSDREAFCGRVLRSGDDFERFKAADDEKVAKEYREKCSVSSQAEGFIEGLARIRELTPSGYEKLDEAISGWRGGLPSGLYVVGAISSLGKTTFLLQMADQMAELGRDVLIYSLEMGRDELIGKSVSRTSFLRAMRDYPQVAPSLLLDKAVTWSDIRDFRAKVERGVLGDGAERLIRDAAAEYFNGAGRRVFIEEGKMGGTTLEDVRARVETHRRMTGKAPVVIVDYLQMVAPEPGTEGASDKTLTDRKILGFKVLSRDFGVPVFVISSLNRASYYKPMSLEAFKESGSIEYSADVVLGLQYPKMAEAKDEKDGARIEQEAKAQDVREVTVKILKNRSGRVGDGPAFRFCAKANYFFMG